MNIEELVQYIKKAQPQSDTLLFDTLALCGEAGEFANIVKKCEYYPAYPYNHSDLVDELSDVFFHVAALCQHLGMSMHNLEQACIYKNSRRFQIEETE